MIKPKGDRTKFIVSIYGTDLSAYDNRTDVGDHNSINKLITEVEQNVLELDAILDDVFEEYDDVTINIRQTGDIREAE